MNVIARESGRPLIIGASSNGRTAIFTVIRFCLEPLPEGVNRNYGNENESR
jgi:hypothetical protein